MVAAAAMPPKSSITKIPIDGLVIVPYMANIFKINNKKAKTMFGHRLALNRPVFSRHFVAS
jgi:hypothetical protein